MSARAEVWTARLPMSRPFASSAVQVTAREVWLLRVLSEGMEGWGELSVLGTDPAPAVSALVGASQTLCAVGAPSLSAAWIDALPPPVRAAVSTALLDLAARQAGCPLAALLHPDALQAVRSNGLVGDGHPTLRRIAIADLVRRGFDTIKLKVGAASWCHELDLLEETATLHRGVRLRLDPNMGWEPEQLGPRLTTLDGLGVEYVEQPLGVDRVDDLLNVEAKGGVGVALDEVLVERPEVLPRILACPRPQVLVLKPGWLGGADRAMALARAAIASGHRVVVTTTLDTSVGRALALHVAAAVDALQAPGVHGLATGELFDSDVDSPPLPSLPRMTVPTRGLGPVPSLDRLQRLA